MATTTHALLALLVLSTPAWPQCNPVETREPNVPEQQPAFEGQTRACAITSDVAFDVRVIAEGLDHPWAVEPLPEGDLLVTERPGRLRIVSASGAKSEPAAGLPRVDARKQGGLLDVVLDPRYTENGLVYWSYAEPREGGNGRKYFAFVCNYPGERQYFPCVEDDEGAPLHRGRFYNNKRAARVDALKMLSAYVAAVTT